ncbi:MAG: class I SAM-dependent methyltransferase [Deltaproteobacteria bacterium]|nr:class I SAM-dependent methyltransferase [Deltaproteobacteria bacterium]
MSDWNDHFTAVSADYRRWRPGYPRALFDYLASAAPGRDLAWDCATGNGQAATLLGELFTRVVATDASAAQIANAAAHPRVEYRVARAESCPLGDASCDLVTVAQAVHWFDIDAFWREVRRVLRPGAVVAVWGYGLAFVGPGIDEAIAEFSIATVGPYWPPERAIVDSAYAGVSFPFEQLTPPAFSMTAQWSLDHMLAYIATWSSVEGYRQQTGDDPMPALAKKLAGVWGEPGGRREISWPLILKVGRV